MVLEHEAVEPGDVERVLGGEESREDEAKGSERFKLCLRLYRNNQL